MKCAWRLAIAAVLFGAACTGDAAPSTPEARAVAIETESCGHASHTTGSGVVVGDGQVVTAAHVVIGSSGVRVAVGTDVHLASVVRVDPTADLALLRVPGVSATPIELTQVGADDAVAVVAGAASGTVDATVVRRLRIDVDDVRSSTRSQRAGYELDVAVRPGDSGAGVFDDDGGLVGIVFAVPRVRADSTFAVRAEEIERLLAGQEREHHCDADASRLVEVT